MVNSLLYSLCGGSLRAKIFEPFEQAGVGKSVSWQLGTGLGLPLCRSLVKLMGGDMKYRCPTTGTGSIFWFSLSLPQAPRALAVASESIVMSPLVPASRRSAKLPGVRVLVADDISTNRKLLVLHLKQVFHKPVIVEAETGEAALREVLARPADSRFRLLLLDEYYQGDAGLLGTQVTSEVRRHEAAMQQPSTPSIIIGVTGNALIHNHSAHSAASGQDRVWGKPFPSAEQMRTELMELLGTGVAEEGSNHG